MWELPEAVSVSPPHGTGRGGEQEGFPTTHWWACTRRSESRWGQARNGAAHGRLAGRGIEPLPQCCNGELTMNNNLVSAVFDSRADAERAVTELRGLGVRDDHLSLIAQQE